jgi:hypothetical protein
VREQDCISGSAWGDDRRGKENVKNEKYWKNPYMKIIHCKLLNEGGRGDK